jgi:hypothetical protein
MTDHLLRVKRKNIVAQTPEEMASLPFGAHSIIEDARLDEFVEAFRETKHHLLNSIAIWVAQAELAKSDPAYQVHLTESVLDRCESIVANTRELERKLRSFALYRE